jgi:hypothetical protein
MQKAAKAAAMAGRMGVMLVGSKIPQNVCDGDAS